MNLLEAKNAGIVDSENRLLDGEALADADGNAVIPVGVEVIGRRAFHNAYKVKALYIPRSVIRVEEDAFQFGCGYSLCGAELIATYDDGADPLEMSAEKGVADFSGVRYIDSFPMKINYKRAGKFEKQVLSGEVELGRIVDGGDAPVEFAHEHPVYTAIDGAIYANGGADLLYYPQVPGSCRAIKVKAPVKRICSRAFGDITSSKLEFKKGLEVIEVDAFKWSRIDTIVLPEGAILLETSTHPYELNESITESHGSFSHAWLKTVQLPQGLREIPDYCFSASTQRRYEEPTYSGSVESIEIPETVARIGAHAFHGCRELTVVVPDTVKIISPTAFHGVKSVSLPSSCESQWGAFLAGARGGVAAIRSSEGGGFSCAAFSPSRDETAWVVNSIRDAVDFETIDKLFKDGSMKRFDNRIRVAVTRLVMEGRGEGASPSGSMLEEYRSYVKKNAKKARKSFEEQGDGLCLSIMDSLGLAPETSTPKAAGKKAEVRKSAAQLVKEAIAAMKKGDASGLDELKPVADKVNPVEAVRLLKYAAIKGDAFAIEKLFEIFGRFELPSIALSRAIAFGNDATARALLAHGVTLGMRMKPVEIKGDTASKQDYRFNRYFDDVHLEDGLDIPGRMGIGRHPSVLPDFDYLYLCAMSSRSDKLVSEYAKEGLFCNRDLKGLMLASLAESDPMYMCGKPKPKLAKQLAAAGGLNEECVCIHVQRGPQRHHADVAEVEDLLYPGCSATVAKAVCAIAPEIIRDCWDERYLRQDAEVVRVFVPHLDPSDFRNTGALLSLLAKSGYDAEVKMVCGWKGVVTEKMIQKAIGEASAAGNVSTAALLIDLRAKLFGDADAGDLSL